ncbi:hypothetical protein BN2497_7447 [Janthinobacterium sp. CG23_2]|nr:hypothetical protein BN2497_7447 [Janthinobacterium sp. CG23_2]CUU30121.1 hypothetical protein BN3177_7447 [Janthinobacterium sp. CG23_2]
MADYVSQAFESRRDLQSESNTIDNRAKSKLYVNINNKLMDIL